MIELFPGVPSSSAPIPPPKNNIKQNGLTVLWSTLCPCLKCGTSKKHKWRALSIHKGYDPQNTRTHVWQMVLALTIRKSWWLSCCCSNLAHCPWLNSFQVSPPLLHPFPPKKTTTSNTMVWLCGEASYVHVLSLALARSKNEEPDQYIKDMNPLHKKQEHMFGKWFLHSQ